MNFPRERSLACTYREKTCGRERTQIGMELRIFFIPIDPPHSIHLAAAGPPTKMKLNEIKRTGLESAAYFIE